VYQSIVSGLTRIKGTFGHSGPIYTGDGSSAWGELDRRTADNPSVFKYGQADGSSIHTSYRDSPSCETNHRGRMIRLLASIYTHTDYQTSYRSFPKLVPDR